MGLSNGNGNSNSGPLVFLTPRAKNVEGEKLDRPYFAVGRVAEDGKIAQTDETPSSIKGDLISVQIKDRVFKKGSVEETSREVSLYIRDNDEITPENPGPRETYRLPLTFSIPSCGLFNSLSALTESGNFKNLKIDYYRNKKGYESYGLEQNDVQIKWKHELSALPKGEPILDKKGALVKNDYSDRDAFFEAEIAAIMAVVNKAKNEHASESAEDTPAEQEAPPTPAPKAVTPAKPAAAAKPVNVAKPVQGAKPATTGGKPAPKPVTTPPPAEANQDDSDSIPF